jgi:hypothetical protein
MVAFLRSALIWATALWAIVVGFRAANEGLRAQDVQTVIVLWVLLVMLVSAYKIVRLARRFGANLGHEIIANPKANVGDTIAKAGKSALEGRWRPSSQDQSSSR